MEINQIILNDNLFRYSLYKNEQSDEYVILLLGSLQDIESVDAFSCTFSKHLNCLTVEVPGTGRTAPLDSTISIREQSIMLLDLVNYLKLKKVHIIAFSYATAIAVEFCDIFPYVSSMSICCGVPGIPESGREATKKAIVACGQNVNEFAKVFTQTLMSDHPEIPRNKAIAKAIKRNISNFSDERRNIFFENSIRLLVHKASNIENISIPCTICVGEYDPYVTKEVAYKFSKKLKNSNFVVIKNADHLVHLQHPEKVASILIALPSSLVAATNSIKKLGMKEPSSIIC